MKNQCLKTLSSGIVPAIKQSEKGMLSRILPLVAVW